MDTDFPYRGKGFQTGRQRKSPKEVKAPVGVRGGDLGKSNWSDFSTVSCQKL